MNMNSYVLCANKHAQKSTATCLHSSSTLSSKPYLIYLWSVFFFPTQLYLDGADWNETCINYARTYVPVMIKGHEFLRLQIWEKDVVHPDMVNKIWVEWWWTYGKKTMARFILFCNDILLLELVKWIWGCDLKKKGQDPIEGTSTFNGSPHPCSKTADFDLSQLGWGQHSTM